MCALAKIVFVSATMDQFFLWGGGGGGESYNGFRNQFYSIQISLRCVLVCDLLIDYDDQGYNFVPLVFNEGAGRL